MINLHETKDFDRLYNFIHNHSEGVYQLIFQDGVEIMAEKLYDYYLYLSKSDRKLAETLVKNLEKL